jgi:hypothetical protein
VWSVTVTAMNDPGEQSRHLSTFIDRSVSEVYACASNPANLPAWAHGLGESVALINGQWVAQSSPMGRVEITFAPRNELGVLDHHVTLPSGKSVYNPLRVIAHGAGSEVVFTLRRRVDMSDADLERDAGMVAADLARLKKLMES